jgi:hypothetical protein
MSLLKYKKYIYIYIYNTEIANTRLTKIINIDTISSLLHNKSLIVLFDVTKIKVSKNTLFFQNY